MNVLPLIACALICSGAVRVQAQLPTPSPSPTAAPKSPASPANIEQQQQETIRVRTEEVRIPIFAYDEYGHFDPTLEADDLLVLEDGVPQQVQSVQRIPASILLLLCASGDINQGMRTTLTRDVALQLVSNLHAGDQIAVVQFTSKVELLQDWTTDRSLITRALGTKDGRPGKLHSGRGTRLAPAVARAAAELQKQPVGNRHVVIIGDGVDVPAWADARELMRALDPNGTEAQNASAALAQATRELIASQATVHVISYREAQKLHENQKKHGSADVTSGFRFDPAMKRLQNAYKKAMQRSEERLTSLAQETGGRLLVPTSAEEMIAEGGEVARDIGAQYVITYKPKRPLASAPKEEYRRLNVVPRRSGLHVRTRRGYVVTTGS
jgi:VWFA-related protein